MADDLGAGVAQDLQVGAQLLVDGGGHADQHEVGGVERLDAIGEHEAVALQVRGEVALFGVEQLGATAADRAEAGAGDVDPDDPAAGVAQGDRGGQADVAEADDGDDGVTGLLGAALGAARCGGGGRGGRSWRGGGGLGGGGLHGELWGHGITRIRDAVSMAISPDSTLSSWLCQGEGGRPRIRNLGPLRPCCGSCRTPCTAVVAVQDGWLGGIFHGVPGRSM